MKKAARVFLILLFVCCVAGAFFYLNEPQMDHVLESPSLRHWAGTDTLGRDLLLRMLQGSFFSWVIGGVAAGISLFIGSSLGAWAGWKKRGWDFALMRIFEVWNSMPSIVLLTLLVLLLAEWFHAEGVWRMFVIAIGIGLTHWVPFARLSRALVLQESSSSYIEGAIAVGASNSRILWTHLRPHLMPAIRQAFWIQLPSCLLFEGLLSFLGFGLSSPQTSLGSLLNEGWKSFSAAPHLLLAPGLLLFTTLLAFQIGFTSREEV